MDVDAIYRLRGALLVGVGVVALALGGWWWRVEAPASPPAGERLEAASEDSFWQEDRIDRSRFRQEPGASSSIVIESTTGAVLVDPHTGQVIGTVSESDAGPGAGRGIGRQAAVWTERASLDAGTALARESRLDRGERNVLIFSCTGPGELLVTVVGARAGDPMTVGCDGTVITTEMVGTGANVTVLFSTAGAASLQLVARLVDPS
ncbi:hypothetical protein JMF97_21035 [Micromonospora fiedleri]|uniref:Uncharacterized protein n=1 Tax=Micromonospora fiedleri TaxID=1157498 RepID=A0ABS1USQ4_9ACTN|nr:MULTISPECIES: hypothetical protein [Micromonospora]MBL6278648.1 hypothetical protein [Micromonospora fiedleri]WSK42882.1 hypothetical protein OG712_01410 [Micromonospora maris]